MPAGRGFIVINSNRYKFIQNQEKTQKTTKKSGHPLDFFITGRIISQKSKSFWLLWGSSGRLSGVSGHFFGKIQIADLKK